MKILHTADLHMDSPFEGLSSGKASARRGEQRMLLARIASLAETEHADAVLLSGDLLDSDVSYYETGEALVRSLGKINAPVFISPGNHDYYSTKSPYARLNFPENVYIFKKNRIECFEFPEKGFRVYGAAFIDNVSASLLDGFEGYREDGMLNIMCIHGDPGVSSSRYNPVSEDQITNSRMHYIGFGHVHKSSGLKKAGDTWYSMPGCPEGRGFDETGRRTVNIIDLDENSCKLQELSVALRNYEQISVDITNADPFLAIQLNLPDDTITDIYRIVLTGERAGNLDINDLYRKLEEYFYEVRILDETHITEDIWEKAGEDTLRGQFLSRLRAKYDAARNDEDRLKIEQAVRWGLAALDNREEVVRHEN